jgi:hypothetical protein
VVILRRLDQARRIRLFSRAAWSNRLVHVAVTP